jgi:hypothetical protein
MIPCRIQRRERDLPLKDCFSKFALSLLDGQAWRALRALIHPLIPSHRGRGVVGAASKGEFQILMLSRNPGIEIWRYVRESSVEGDFVDKKQPASSDK